MLHLKKRLLENTILKITSVNAVVISIRLVISVFIQRFLATTVGEAGIANIGQVRNLIAMVTSTSTLGVFNGIVRFISEHKTDKEGLQKLFSTVALFFIIGTVVSSCILGFGADYLSRFFFSSTEFRYVFLLLAVVMPFIGIHRIFNGVVHGLSKYKSYAKIDVIAYVLSAIALVIGLIYFGLQGAIIAILVTPIIQLLVLLFIFVRTIRQYITFKNLGLNFKYRNELLAFTVMSFVTTFLFNYIELDIRRVIGFKLGIDEAGYWTAMTNISKNYMVFSSGILTLYVLPRFATIGSEADFKKEVFHIYKTILPIFALGMLLVYLFRNFIIALIYPDFYGVEPLFKWQLLGDFIRLASVVVAHQFLAKKMVKSFIFTELVSLGLFYILSHLLIAYCDTEGVVIAHFIRFIVYYVAVLFVLKWYFSKQRT